jgi:GntR family transcriptional repressor for pyruvate dehydrogenase complex
MEKLASIKKESMTEQSRQALKDFIINGSLKAGDFLPPEIELSKRLGIGRSTLREAVKTLELQGFVKKKQGVGVMVVEESDKAATDMLQLMLQRSGSSFKELHEVRFAIELKTVELAVKKAREKEIAQIGRYVEVMQDNITKQEEYIRADMNFHLAIAKASHNNLFSFILQTIRPLIEEMIESTLKHNHHPEQSMKYHEKIYLAIKKRDVDAAVNAMKNHLQAGESVSNE